MSLDKGISKYITSCVWTTFTIFEIMYEILLLDEVFIHLCKIIRFLHKCLVKLEYNIDKIDLGVDWVLMSIEYKCRFDT